MKTKDTNMKESQVTATLTLDRKKADAVGKVRDVVSAIKANPAYAATPEVQGATVALSASADAVDQNQKALTALRAQEKSLLTTQIVLVAALKRSVKSVVAVITEVAAGSADGIKKWGLDVAGRQPSTPSDAPPEGLRATYGKGLALVIRWKGVRHARGYELQIGDGTAQGWGQPFHSTVAHYVPVGLAPGQHISVRVAVHRTSGLSAYSDPVVIVVR